ncbi:MAG TPA: BON domain-containing protein [Chloroflexi bacterium]|nr:BON domain-containing protein [Chloroflexota bacterium]
MDSHTQRVTDLIVERGFLQKTDRVIPVSVVGRTDEGWIDLSIAKDEFERYPEYEEVKFTQPVSGWEDEEQYKARNRVCWHGRYRLVCREPVVPRVERKLEEGIGEGQETLGTGTPVLSREGTFGKVDHVLVNPANGKITHLVVRRGIISYYPVIPMDMVKEISADGVYVDEAEETLENLPLYRQRDDVDTLLELQDRLEEASPFDLSDVQVEVDDGVVTLTGRVRDIAVKRYVEAAAREVDGVIDVKNMLGTDTVLVARVVTALAEDPRTDLASIDVISEQGVVTLKGRVDSAEIKAAAEEVAYRQAGVISVVNALEVEADDVTELISPWLLGATNPFREP